MLRFGLLAAMVVVSSGAVAQNMYTVTQTGGIGQGSVIASGTTSGPVTRVFVQGRQTGATSGTNPYGHAHNASGSSYSRIERLGHNAFRTMYERAMGEVSREFGTIRTGRH